MTLAAGDANPPITMCFSNDGTTYTSPWENYATSRLYNLPTGDGSKTVYVKFKDAAGNISTPVSGSIILDNTPPSGTSISINNDDAYTRSTAVTLTLAAGDANPPITMCFSNDGTTYTSPWENYATSRPYNLPTGDGSKTVYVKFKDAAGNISTPVSNSIILDNTPPTGTSISINNGDAYTRSTAVTLTLAAGDANPPITMCFSNDGTTYTSPWENYATSRPYNLPTGDGSKTVYVKFKDAAGNISTPVSSSIILDNTPPTGTSISINNDDAYTRSTAVTLTLAAGDANPPITMCFSNDGTTYTSPWENYATSRPYNLPTGDGSKTVYVKFKDAAGNISTPVSSSIILDNTPPSGTSIKINNGDAYTRSTAVTLTLAAGDANPPITMCFSNDGTTYTSPWENYATSRPYNLPTGDGAKTVYVKFKDAAGNISTPVSSSIILDNTPPSGTSIKINNDDAYTRSTAVTLTLAAGDANPPITMCFSNDGTTYTSPWENYATSRPYNLPAGDGSKTVYVKFKDAAGNISTPVSGSIILDNTPPSGTSISINNGDAYTRSTAVNLTLAAADANPPITMCFSDDGTTYTSPWENYATSRPYNLPAGDGSKTVYVKFKDAAGNISTPVSSSIILDNTPPSGTSIKINNGDAYTRSTAVTLTLAAGDANPPITMCFSNDGTTYTSPWENYATSRPYNLPTGDGSKTVYVKFKDAAGNISTPVSNSIILDNTTPTGTSISINNGDAYTRSTAVTLTLAAGDANPPITMCFSNDGTTYTSPWENYATSRPYNLPTGDGSKTVYVKFKDAAGNISTPVSSSIILDMTPPTGTSISINNDDAYTRSTAVTLTLAAGDANPPITMCFSNDGTTYTSPWENYATSRPYNLPTGDGAKTVYVKFKDAAGNISTPVSHSIILDTTPPTGTILINGGASITKFAAVTLTLAASDANPPITMCFSNDGATYTTPEAFATTKNWTLSSEDGAKTVHVQFKDAAGNIGTAAANITLDTTHTITATAGANGSISPASATVNYGAAASPSPLPPPPAITSSMCWWMGLPWAR